MTTKKGRRFEDGQWVGPCNGNCGDELGLDHFSEDVEPDDDEYWCSRCWKDEKIRRLEARVKELEGEKVSERDRDADMLKLADAFFENLERDDVEYGGWGVDSKRPFGNSYVEGDILEIIGYETKQCPHCDEPLNEESDEEETPEQYAASLYSDLGDFLKEKWNEFRNKK